ncbi:MAG TPA: Eco57I restriction-modification methylase domain-containing protein, partial [Candidatus Hydrogenedentes bacterium]|nr:Eco57I restriction-modification methylase domain-containing protein [Candidatus Hydrogenedentota bacterium]
LVHLLRRLDPDNAAWRARNRAPLEEQRAAAARIADPALRDDRLREADAALAAFDDAFAERHHADYSRKLFLVEKCLHGVDIQPVAVQIAKLRFFISLIVSQDTDPARPNCGVIPLPNLETKIVAADTLAVIRRKDAQTSLRYEAVDEKERELAEAGRRYFAVRTGKTKRRLRDTIARLRAELIPLLQEQGLPPGDAGRLVHWDPFDQNAAADFFDPEWMFQVTDGFDIVIGNPPYVRQEKIKHLKDALKADYECYTGTADLYVYFYERAVSLLRPGGVLSFITSNKWYRAKYGEKLRPWMVQNTVLRRILDFGDEDVFTAVAYPTIVIAQRRPAPVAKPPGDETVLAYTWTPGAEIAEFPALFAAGAFPVPQAALDPRGWQLEPPAKRGLLERIRAAGTPLGEYVNGRFYRGILTGLNAAFVIDGPTRARLIAEDPKSEEIIKPFLRGRDVKRWRVQFADRYLIKIESSENVQHPWSGMGHQQAEKCFAKCFPAVYRWFGGYRDQMISRYDQGHYFWELRSCAYWAEFEGPKIFVPAMEGAVNYAPDLTGYYGNDKTNIIVTDEWRPIMALLNSSVSWWITQQTFSTKQGGFYEFKPMYVSQIPIPPMTPVQKTMLDALIDVITATRDPRFERLSNALVYELFFPEELHGADIRLFEALGKTDLPRLSGLTGEALVSGAGALGDALFAADHPVRQMLSALDTLEVVRIIEGKA